MNKLVLKTAVITVCSIIAVLAVLFGAFALFFPRAIASVGARLGNYSVAVTFYERQYNLTGSAVDLADLIETIDEEKDFGKAFGYARKFINDFDGYDGFISNYGASRFSSEIAAEEFYYSKFVRAAIAGEKYDDALAFSRKFFDKNGYTERNPYSVIVSVACEKRNIPADKITLFRDDVASKKEGRTSAETERMEFDISQLSALLSD